MVYQRKGLATIIGAVGGLLVVFSIIALDRMKLDNPVGISAHGTAGIWGLLAVVFTTGTLSAQLYGIVVIFLWTFVVSSLFWYAIHLTWGVRVSDDDEEVGVDVSECGLDGIIKVYKIICKGTSVYINN